jgi:hypothetical protein
MYKQKDLLLNNLDEENNENEEEIWNLMKIC